MVNSIVYDMSDFFKQAVADYKKLAKTEHLRQVTTPFVPGNADEPRQSHAMSAAAARYVEYGNASGDEAPSEQFIVED